MFSHNKMSWELALLVLLITEILICGIFNNRMLNISTLLFSTNDFIAIGIIALPLTLVVISGGIDLSFGSTIGLCAISLGIMYQNEIPMWMVLILTVLIGMCCGLFNAFLINYTNINPLVITLGTLYLYGGAALLLSGLSGATGFEGIGGFSESFTNFANLTLLGIPIPLIIFFVMIVFYAVLTHKTKIGRAVFLIGQNQRVSKYTALPVNKIQYLLYVFVGISSSLVAIILTSYFGSARSDLGVSFLMPAITAVVLGGANIYGGSGSIIGTALAVLLIGYLQQGLQMVGVPNQISSALSGALLVIVVIGRSIFSGESILRKLFHRVKVVNQ